jgi:arylsulfatase A-like enzyme
VAPVDEGVGRILAALAKTDQLDDTVIVFASDQGYGFGEHGVIGKLAPYDANMRIPLIVRFPAQVPAGTINDRPIGLLDLPPTFLALAGIPLPWEMHGHDFGGLLRDPSARWNHPVLLENFHASYGPNTDVGRMNGEPLLGIPWWVSYRQGRYKYIRSLIDDAVEELYDLDADPGEFYNLAVRPQHAARLTDFRQRFLNELERTNARFVRNIPEPRVVTSYPATSYLPPDAEKMEKRKKK